MMNFKFELKTEQTLPRMCANVTLCSHGVRVSVETATHSSA